MRRPTLAGCLIAVALVAGCGDDSKNDAASTPEANSSAAAESGSVDLPDACTFFSVDELESALGTTVQPGKSQQAPEGTSACRFSGIANVTINTYETTAGDFADFEELNGGTSVDGLGDAAFTLDDVLLHVRVGDLAFSIRVNDEQHQVADLEQAKRTLAEEGVQKLQ